MNKSNFNGLLLVGIMVIGILAIPLAVSANAITVISDYTVNGISPYYGYSNTQVSGNRVYHTTSSSSPQSTLLNTIDNGTSWSTLISDSNANINLDASNSTLFVVETTQFPSTTFTQSSTNNGTSFTTNANLPNSSAMAYLHSPCIINKDNSNITVIAVAFSLGTGFGGSDAPLIVKSTSANGGSSWTTPTILVNGTTGFSANNIGALKCSNNSGDGKVAVIYHSWQFNGNFYNDTLAYLYTSDFGATFTQNNFILYPGPSNIHFIRDPDGLSNPSLFNNILYECTFLDPDGAVATNKLEYDLFAVNVTSTLGSHIVLQTTGQSSGIVGGCNSYPQNGALLNVMSSGTAPTVFSVVTNLLGTVIVESPTNIYNSNFIMNPQFINMPNAALKIIGGKNSAYTSTGGTVQQYNLTVGSIPLTPTNNNSVLLANTPIELALDYNYNPTVYAMDNPLNDNGPPTGKIYTYNATLVSTSSSQYCPNSVSDPNNYAGLAFTVDNFTLFPCKVFPTSIAGYSAADQIRSQQMPSTIAHFRLTNLLDTSDSRHICAYDIDASSLNAGEGGAASYWNYQTDAFIVQRTSVPTGQFITDCYVDKFDNHMVLATTQGTKIYNSTGTLVAQTAISTSFATSANGVYYTSNGTNPVKLTKYTLNALNVLTQVTQVNETNGLANQYLSPDGKYLITWNGGQGFPANNTADIWDTSNMTLLKSIVHPSNTIDCKMDIANNGVYCLATGGNIYETNLFGTTCSTAGCGNSTTPNPVPTTGLPNATSNTTSSGSITIGPGSGNGGYVGNATTFFGFNISYLATQFGIDVTAVQWLLGILVVALVIYGLGASNPIIIAVAILLGVGLATLFGLFPVWLLLVLVFLLIAMVARLFFGRGGGDEM